MLPSFHQGSVATLKVLLLGVVVDSFSPSYHTSPSNTSTSGTSTAVDVIFDQNDLIIRPRDPNSRHLPPSIRCANLRHKSDNNDVLIMRDAHSGASRHDDAQPPPDVLVTAAADDDDSDGAIQCTVHKQDNYVRALIQFPNRSYVLRSSADAATGFSMVRLGAEDGRRGPLDASLFLRRGAAARRLQASGSESSKGYIPLTCWKTYAHTLKIGIAVDAGFYAKFGNTDESVRNHVLFLLELASKPFEKQLNIHLKLSELILPTQGVTRPMNQTDDTGNYTLMSAPIDDDGNCENPPLQLRTRAKAFNAWRMKYHQKQYGVWHLLTVCNDFGGQATGGTFGTAGHKGVCSLNNAYGATRARTGADTDADITFYFLIHELGHNLGAKHTWETDGCKLADGEACTIRKGAGVMDKDPLNIVSKWEGEIQFHPIHADDLCTTIADSLSNTGFTNKQIATSTNEADDDDVRIVYNKDLCWSISATPTATVAPTTTTATTATSASSNTTTTTAKTYLLDLDRDTFLFAIISGGVMLVVCVSLCFMCFWACGGRQDKSGQSSSRVVRNAPSQNTNRRKSSPEPAEQTADNEGRPLPRRAYAPNSPPSRGHNGGSHKGAAKNGGKGRKGGKSEHDGPEAPSPAYPPTSPRSRYSVDATRTETASLTSKGRHGRRKRKTDVPANLDLPDDAVPPLNPKRSIQNQPPSGAGRYQAVAHDTI